ncbi:MAG TPA: hypothetical protein P5110_04330 [Candidatus Omnitrophota bacterium]|nr:hypothetical protein [Candidatus Omnitrophota bacterium]HRZ14720.1 hypothetical protein [Candidatus Omnitrophota bacterium]
MSGGKILKRRIQEYFFKEERIIFHVFRGIFRSLILILSFLMIGIFLFMKTEKLGFHDSLYETAMIMTGMGPAIELQTNSGKIFASIFAMVSVGVVISSITFVFGPIYRRWHKKMHIEIQQKTGGKE